MSYSGGSDVPPNVSVDQFTDAKREQVARKLGRYILAQLPYGKTKSFPVPIGDVVTPDVAIPKVYAAEGKTKTVSGLYPHNHAEDPYIREPFVGLPGMLDNLTTEEFAELETWTMNGVPHTITKALRIWYTYQIEDADAPGGKRTVGAWLLVGYLGDGH